MIESVLPVAKATAQKIVEAAAQKIVEAAAETIEKKIQNLPEQLGSLSKIDGLPAEISLETETNGLPAEISLKTETDGLPAEISLETETDRLPEEIGAETDDLSEEIGSEETDTSEGGGLTEEQRAEVKEKTGWSDDVLDNINSMEEADIYLKAGLREVEIGGKKCLIRGDIDWEQKDEKGRTNSERIQRGLAPLDQEGNAIELHHIGQHADSPLAELTHEEHRCNGNDTILHDKSIESEVHGEGNNWSNERQDYWKGRSEYNEGGTV